MSIGTRLIAIGHQAVMIEQAMDDIIMCHDWTQETTPRRPIEELRAQLAEAIERLKRARA